jgi:hypothetical protein
MVKYIGFLSNKLTLRGTEIAMYDYADYNETMLNNKSLIISRDYNLIKHVFDVSEEAYTKFKKRFTVEYYNSQKDIDNIVEKYNSEGEKKYSFLTLDDGSGQIKLKIFGDDVEKFKNISQGQTVLIIGNLR